MSSKTQKIIVGSEEWCGFPDLGLPAVKARVDSGAKTSSLHAFNLHPFKREGVSWVSFDMNPLQHNRRIVVHCEAPVIDRRGVKSSSGASEKRYVIGVTIHLGKGSWEIELTLADRDTMGYRMLLGREAMSGRMLVDPSASFCLGEIPTEKIEKYYEKNGRQKDGLKIGLLASNPDLYSNQRLMAAGEERGHRMCFLSIKYCSIKLDAKRPEVRYRGGKRLSGLDAVIPRIRPNMTSYGCALVRQFENIGIYSLNSASAISQSRDKLFYLQHLLKNGLDLPVTGFANASTDIQHLVETAGGVPLVVKPLRGTEAGTLILAETRRAAKSVISAFKSLHSNLILQEYIKEAEGKDVRCFVIGGKVIASIQREAAADPFHNNAPQGRLVSVVKLTHEEQKFVVKAAKILDLKFAEVAILRSRRGPLILKINASPSFEEIEAVTGKDIAGNMIASIEKKMAWKRTLS